MTTDEEPILPHAEPLTPEEALALIVPVVREAGEVGLGFVEKGARSFTKADASPVTEADLAINAHLAARLRPAAPGVGWLSEEDPDDTERLSSRQVFILDPIDGTRGFIAGNGEWMISVALVEAGRPVAGVLFRPTTADLYEAGRGLGARKNGLAIRVTPGATAQTRSISGPRAGTDLLAGDLPALKRLPGLASLALRLALVAEGHFDAAYAKTDCHDWDIAAADLILEEAGGRLTTLDGEAIAYNRPVPRHPALVAAGLERQDGLRQLLRERTRHGS